MKAKFQYSNLILSITEAIDLISPIVANHHKLVAYISYNLGKQLGLSTEEQIELEIAGSLHDIGGLTLLERLDPTRFEYKDSNLHTEKGYLLLKNFKPLSNVARLIRYHHQNWFNGECLGIDNQLIPLGSHILNLADRVSTLISNEDENILNLVEEVIRKIRKYEGSVFNTKVVEAFIELSKKDSFWLEMRYLGAPSFVNEITNHHFDSVNDENFEEFIILISRIIDFKSRFTAAHSSTVGTCAESIAKYLGFNKDELKMIRYAGYIHDLGKLAIPTEILEKPAPLSKEEFALMRSHTFHTNRVLSKVAGFDTIRIWGALHHEKLNGKGYPFGLKDKEIPLGARIMAVADIFAATREKRSYRDSMSKEKTIDVLVRMANSYDIDEKIVDIVNNNFDEIDKSREKAYKNAILEYEKFTQEFETSKNSMLNFDCMLDFD